MTPGSSQSLGLCWGLASTGSCAAEVASLESMGLSGGGCLPEIEGSTGQSADEKRPSRRQSWCVGTWAKGTAYGPHSLCALLQARGFSKCSSMLLLYTLLPSHRLVSTLVCELRPERQGRLFVSCVPTPSSQHMEALRAQRAAATRSRVCVESIAELSSGFPDLKTQGVCLYQK